jgi:hypothetical protein
MSSGCVGTGRFSRTAMYTLWLCLVMVACDIFCFCFEGMQAGRLCKGAAVNDEGEEFCVADLVTSTCPWNSACVCVSCAYCSRVFAVCLLALAVIEGTLVAPALGRCMHISNNQ